MAATTPMAAKSTVAAAKTAPAASAVPTAAATAAANPAQDPVYLSVVARALARLVGWPGPPSHFVDITNHPIDQSLDALTAQLDQLIATSPVGGPARWVTDSLNFAAVLFTSLVPGYTAAGTLNAIGDFLNRVVPPFKIADGAGALDVISVYKIMGAAVAGTATALGDMLNGVYDLDQIAIDVIYSTTGATVTRDDLHGDGTSLELKVVAGILLDGGAYMHPERAWDITLPTWTAAQVNPFTLVTYVALVAIYKRFQEIATLQTFTTSTTYDSWHYTNALGMYAAGSFHAVDDLGRAVDFFGVSQGGTFTTTDHALVTINTSDGGFTYTPPSILGPYAQNAAYLHRSTSENEADRYDTVNIPVTSADGVNYTLTFKISIIDGTNAAPTGPSTVTSTDALGVVKGKVNGSDSDGDTLKYSLVGSSVNGLSGNSAYTKSGAGNGGIVTIDPTTGDFTYVSSATAGATQSFDVMINDGHYGNTVTTVTVTNSTAAITPANIDTSTPYVETGSVPGSTNFPGVFTSYALGSATTPKGSVTLVNPTTGVFTYTSNVGRTTANDDVVTLIATDANGRTVTLNLAVKPAVVDSAPSVVSTTTSVGSTDPTKWGLNTSTWTQTTTGKITATDSDGDSLSYSLVNPTTHLATTTTTNGGTVAFNTDGSYTYTITKSQTYFHNAAKIGASGATVSDSFTVAVSDGYGGTAYTTVNMAVYAYNTQPTIGGAQTTSGFALVLGLNSPLVTSIQVHDADGDLGSSLNTSNNGTGAAWYTETYGNFVWLGDNGLSSWSQVIGNNPTSVTLTFYDGYYRVTNGIADTNTPDGRSVTYPSKSQAPA